MSIQIIKRPSPNRYSGRSGWKPDMIVMHITDGSFDGAVSWLQNPRSKASAHFVVGRDGRVAQLVDLKDAAWTNGTSTDPKNPVYHGHATNPIVRSRATNANYYTVTIEHEGIYSQTRGELTEAQFRAVVELVKYIRSEVKRIYGIDIPLDRQHIVGHYEVNPRTKPTCPGEKYPFDRLIAELKKQEGETMARFKDTSGHWAEKYIDRLAELGIVSGRSDGTFAPNDPITRAEAAVLIARALGLLEKKGAVKL